MIPAAAASMSQRVVQRFGVDVTAIYPVGGTIGRLLQHLVEHEGITSRAIPVNEDTREDFTAYERKTGHEFRFVVSRPAADRGPNGATASTPWSSFRSGRRSW